MVQAGHLYIGDGTGDALARAARLRGQSVDDVLRSLLGLTDNHSERGASAANGHDFEPVWRRVCDLAGTEFATRHGQRFTYVVDGRYLEPSTSEVRIPLSQFKKAHAMGPTRGPASLRGVFAPSLVWAVLNDPRVAGDSGNGRGSESSPAFDPRATWPDDFGPASR